MDGQCALTLKLELNPLRPDVGLFTFVCPLRLAMGLTYSYKARDRWLMGHQTRTGLLRSDTDLLTHELGAIILL